MSTARTFWALVVVSKKRKKANRRMMIGAPTGVGGLSWVSTQLWITAQILISGSWD